MTNRFTEIAFTDAVVAQQEAMGSRALYDRHARRATPHNRIGEDEAAFIAGRDSFYMATISSSGWPYVQHRGGPAGFLKVLDETRLAFADFRGNRQYVSVGNLAGSDKTSLLLMDYPQKARLKIFGHASASQDPKILQAVHLDDYKAKIERAIVVELEGFDWNCPAHITQRFTQAEVAQAVMPLHHRIRDLEAALDAAGINLSA